MVTLYLLHFNQPYKHARHYLGSAEDLRKRLAEHAAGHGVKLIKVIQEAGITWSLARTWDNASRADESRLKHTHHRARLCPLCNPQAERRGQLKKGKKSWQTKS